MRFVCLDIIIMTGWFQIAKHDGFGFTNSKSNDVLIRTCNNQAIHLGAHDQVSSVMIESDVVKMNKPLQVQSIIDTDHVNINNVNIYDNHLTADVITAKTLYGSNSLLENAHIETMSVEVAGFDIATINSSITYHGEIYKLHASNAHVAHVEVITLSANESRHSNLSVENNINTNKLHCQDTQVHSSHSKFHYADRSFTSNSTCSSFVASNVQVLAFDSSNAYIYNLSNTIGHTHHHHVTTLNCSNAVIDQCSISNAIAVKSTIALLKNHSLHTSNIGVGTSSPLKAIHVEQGKVRVRCDDSNAHLELVNLGDKETEMRFLNKGETIFDRFAIGFDGCNIRGVYMNLRGDDAITIQSSSTLYHTVVGIGTNTPQEKLDVIGGIAVNNVPCIDINRNICASNVHVQGHLKIQGILETSNDSILGDVNAKALHCHNIDTQHHNIQTWDGIVNTRQLVLPNQGGLYMSTQDTMNVLNNKNFYTASSIQALDAKIATLDNRAYFTHTSQTHYAVCQDPNGNTVLSGSRVLISPNNNNTLAIINNRVGINTEYPVSELDVHGGMAICGCNFVDSKRHVVASNITSMLYFTNGSNPTNSRQTAGYYLVPERSFGIELQRYTEQSTPVTYNRWATTFIARDPDGGFMFKTVKQPFVQNDIGRLLMVLNHEGRLGIGTEHPLQKLHVRGAAYITGFVGVGNSNPIANMHIEGTNPMYIKPKYILDGQESCILAEPPFSMNKRQDYLYHHNAVFRTNFSQNVQDWNVTSVVNNGRHVTYTTQTGDAYFEGDFGIGFGSYYPVSKLDVRGTVTVTHDSAPGILVTSTSNYTSNAPYVSIRALINEAFNSNAAYSGTLALSRYNLLTSLTSNMPLGRIIFGGNYKHDNTSNLCYTAGIYGIAEDNFQNTNNMPTYMSFRTSSNGQAISDNVHTERVRISANGNTGINIIPQEKLHVDGTSRFDLRVIHGPHIFNIGSHNHDLRSTNPNYHVKILDIGLQCHAQFDVILDNVRIVVSLYPTPNGSGFTSRYEKFGELVAERFDIFLVKKQFSNRYDVFARVINNCNWNVCIKCSGDCLLVTNPVIHPSDPTTDNVTYVDKTFQTLLAHHFLWASEKSYYSIGTNNNKGPLHVENPVENPEIIVNTITPAGYLARSSSGDPITVFNKSTSTKWVSASSTNEYIELVYPHSTFHILQSYQIIAPNDSDYTKAPIAWKVQGSRDGIDYITLQDVSNISWGYPGQVQTFQIESQVVCDLYYNRFRINFSVVPIQIQQVKFWTTLARFTISPRGDVGIGALYPRNKLHVEGDSLFKGRMIVHDGIDSGVNRGLYMWSNNETNWGIYMASSSSGRTMANTPPLAANSGTITALALRMRVADNEASGFILENGNDKELLSVAGSSGTTYIRGKTGILTYPLEPYSLLVGALTPGACIKTKGVYTNVNYTTHSRMYMTDDHTGIGAGAFDPLQPNAFYMFKPKNTDIRFMSTDDGFTNPNTPSVWVNDMIIKADSGNVGIGHAAPLQKLHVYGGVNITQFTNSNWQLNGLCFEPTAHAEIMNNSWGLLQFSDPSAHRNIGVPTHYLIGRGNTYSERRMTITIPSSNAYSYANNAPAPTLQVVTHNNSNLMTVRSTDGFVGIGTSNPTHKLYLKHGNMGMTLCNFIEFGHTLDKANNAGIIGYASVSGLEYMDITGAGKADGRRIRLHAESNTEILGPVTVGLFDSLKSYISFAGNENHTLAQYNDSRHTFIGEAYYINSSGLKAGELALVKLGRAENNLGPDRIRHIAANHVFQVYNVNQSSTGSTFKNALAGSYTNALIIKQSGNVGIKTTTPGYELHVSGNICATSDVIAFSDARVKKDLRIVPFALDKIKSISGYTFTRTDLDTQQSYAGLIAQEVEKVLPEVVSTDQQGMKSIAYGNVSALLVQGIKELNAKVDKSILVNMSISVMASFVTTFVMFYWRRVQR